MTAAVESWFVAAVVELSDRARSLRFEAMFDTHHDRVWRTLRRLGIADADADDATQRVFLVAVRRLDEIRAGEEMPYLYGIALRVASEMRRRNSARHVVAEPMALERIPDRGRGADELLIASEARALLDDVLAELPDELRRVFILVELEELPVATVAEILSMPAGTAASRLRRAREAFSESIQRLQARLARGRR